MRRLRIVCHNAFWFQGSPYAPAEPGEPVPDVLGALVQIYGRLEPQALCLQEIQGDGVFARLCARTALSGSYCPGGLLTQYGGAVLWRAGRLAADCRGSEDPPERMWQIAEVPDGDGAVLIANVHLPSSRHLGEETAARRRIEEMAAVVEHDPAPDIVLGDLNEQPGGPLGGFLAERGYEDAAVLTGRTHVGTTPNGRRNDQIWVARARWNAVVDYGVVPNEEMTAHIPRKDYLSDHFPVWIDLDTEREE